jgi:hypothetical protein
MPDIYTKLIRYTIPQENCPENKRLVRALVDEIRSEIPDGFGYLAFDLGEGVFLHIADSRKDGVRERLHTLPCFKSWAAHLSGQCGASAEFTDVDVLGGAHLDEIVATPGEER